MEAIFYFITASIIMLLAPIYWWPAYVWLYVRVKHQTAPGTSIRSTPAAAPDIFESFLSGAGPLKFGTGPPD
ncbi:MAG: hypothetical protein LW694_13080 [Chitinophagaceae bacterium]|nr:hypothetical protein [Chitinophagaceae bacterium]